MDFEVPYWRGLEVNAARSYFAAMPGWQPIQYGGIPAARSRNNEIEIVTHPLWVTDENFCGPQLAAAYAAARAAGCRTVKAKSLFEVLRRPF